MAKHKVLYRCSVQLVHIFRIQRFGFSNQKSGPVHIAHEPRFQLENSAFMAVFSPIYTVPGLTDKILLMSANSILTIANSILTIKWT